jgi:hypothetical protein
MRIKQVINGGVTLSLDPGECLMLAEACVHAASDATDTDTETSRRAGAIYDLGAAYFEALAMLGAVTNHTLGVGQLLAEWTLPTVRRDWIAVATHREVAPEEVAG